MDRNTAAKRHRLGDVLTRLRRDLLVLAGLAALFAIPGLALVLLLLFAGILLSIFLSALADFVSSWTRIPRVWALSLTVTLLVATIAISCWLTGPQIVEQTDSLSQRIPEALQSMQEGLRGSRLGRMILDQFNSSQTTPFHGSSLLWGLTGAFSITVETLTGAFFVFFVGIYLAASPQRYIDGMVRLLPPGSRDCGIEVFESVARALRWWLLGRALTMVIMGATTTIALLIAGIPLALTLGLIAGVFLFVPYIGSILSAVPAILVGFTQGSYEALVVIAIYIAIHLIEGYTVTPLIQKRAVALPPALLISVQLLIGFLFGVPGLLLATPLTVGAVVVVQILYLQQTLGEDIEVSGEH